jgi:hypothetical protein
LEAGFHLQTVMSVCTNVTKQRLSGYYGGSVVGLGILTVVIVAVNLGGLGGSGKIEWIVVKSIHQRLDIISIS